MARLLPVMVLALGLVGCGGGPGDSDGNSGGPDAGEGGGGPDAGAGPVDSDLETATGCTGVFNVDQLLDYELTMTPGDWSRVLGDSSNSIYVPAELSCGGSAPIQVGVRHKRSGSSIKPGLKIDINRFVAGQRYLGLKKLSLENGISESPDPAPTGALPDLLAEYLAWRMHVLGGAVTGRASFARVWVNGELVGTYVNVEVVDKRFLENRLGDDSGWLFKYSGSAGDGQKTREGTTDPYAAALCFLDRNGCATPPDSELAAILPDRLDIPQLLTVGAVNAAMANTDAILLKFNNYIYYDHAAGPRMYFPWDLDSAMKADYHVFTGTVPGGTTRFTDALFGNWEDDYAAILTRLLDGPLAVAAIEAELERAVMVAGPALDADPHLDGNTAAAAEALAAWWAARHAQVSGQLAAR